MTLLQSIVGASFTLPPQLLREYPDLSDASWRRGGVALRIGGWFIGRPTVSGITLWRTIFIAPGAAREPELLLHELRHVHQFVADPRFPLRYLWRSLRHGYPDTPYEADARAFAARRLAGAHPSA